MENIETQNEIWQVDVNGQIYEAPLGEFRNWILEGAIAPTDKVRRGNLRWLEAGKVPLLFGVFQMRSQGVQPTYVDASQPIQAVEETQVSKTLELPNLHNSADFSDLNSGTRIAKHEVVAVNIAANNAWGQNVSGSHVKQNVCSIHNDTEPFYVCSSCSNLFCKTCPKNYSSVRICPTCGEMCKPLMEVTQKADRQMTVSHDMQKGFGIGDLATALQYPFKRPVTLFVGGLLTSLLGIGLYLGFVSSMFGMIQTGAAAILVCGIFYISLVYGSSFKVINLVTYGDYDDGFSLKNDDFSFFDNILHPAFLGLATFAVTWLPMLVVVIFAIWSISSSVQQPTNSQFQITNEQNSKAGSVISEEESQHQINLQALVDANNPVEQQEALRKLNSAEAGLRGASVPDLNPKISEAAVTQAVKKAMPFLLAFILAALWGFLYFPLSLMVAGYTDSVGSTLNPLVGLGTAGAMGFNYFKAFCFYFLLLLIVGSVYRILGFALSPFSDSSGNLPLQFFSGFVTYYLYLAIGCLLGLSMYKSSDKLAIKV